MGGPEIGVPGEAFEHIFMVHALVFLGVVPPAGPGGVEVWHGLAAVLGVAQGAFRVAEMGRFGKNRWNRLIHRSLRNRPGTYQPRYRFQLTASVMWAEGLNGPHMA